MNVFNQVKRSARRASFEAERMLRIEREQAQIGAFNSQLRNGITRLGQLTYDLARRGEVTHAELQQFCTQLDELRSQIAAHEAEIETIRADMFVEEPGDGAYCAVCGAACAPSTLFCPRCGSRLAATSRSATAASGVACPRCTATNRPGVLFCVQCGHALSGQTVPRMSRSSPKRMLPDVGVTPPGRRQVQDANGA